MHIEISNQHFQWFILFIKNLYKQACDKIKFADADTYADNASLVIKCWISIIYVKSLRTEWNID